MPGRFRPHRLLTLFAALILALACNNARAQIAEIGNGGPGPAQAQHLTATLTALSNQIPAGGHLTAGLILTMDPHWHVYWSNAGDAGEPPQVKWTLPSGITAAPMQFPPPKRFPLGPFMDFGYENQVVFPIELTATPGAAPGKIHLDAHITWIVCSDRCIPGKAHLGLNLTVAPPGSTGGSALPGSDVLQHAVAALPKPLPPNDSITAVADAQQIALTIKTGSTINDAAFYPYDQNVIANAAAQTVEPMSDGVRLRLERAPDPSGAAGKFAALPKEIHGLIELGSGNAPSGYGQGQAAYDFSIPVKTGVLPPVSATAKTTASSTTGEQKTPGTPAITFLPALGLAFLGGLILNLMPCVFPVLFLKGLALVHSSQEERSRQRAHGLVYTLGILISFWIIVGLLVGFRSSGKAFGWGFQLQSPSFVAVLALLMFFLALSLAGQFELGLSLTSAGNDLAQKQGFAGSFFTGMLAVVAATPCMGPLMGAAIGFALAQPSWVTFAVFTALALGLALPYLLLSMNPHWTRILPKPGAWMEVLKQLTAIPLFATAIWLTWVYGRLYSGNAAEGVNHIASLLSAFLLLAIAGWVLGRWPARWGAAAAALVLIILAVGLPLRKTPAQKVQWQSWSPSSLAAARATGKPVFVDFTAAWCLSCQVNERAVLDSSEVENKLNAAHFQLLRADWTSYDPAITQALASVQRSGVPTYVIYPAGASSTPDVLPELLTRDIVVNAIDKDAQAK